MIRKYWLETYGCQMNMAESNSLEINLKTYGWEKAETEKTADIVILNTCAVRQTAENRIWGRIGYFKNLKKSHRFSLAVIGCMAERLNEKLREKTPAVDIVAGTFKQNNFIKVLEDSIPNSLTNIERDETYKFADSYSKIDNFRTFIPIMRGCNNFCTYCIVPYVRGREISRPADDILKELNSLDTKRVKEITLLGQNVTSYHYRHNHHTIDFPELLTIIASQTDIEWIRFLSSHPKDFSDSLISILSKESVFCNHIHLPVQHGSNAILDSMNRKYSREYYLKLIKKIREAIPDASITTDLLIGFPGETEQDIELTIDLMKSVEFEDAFTYQYNPREGTKAASYPGKVPDTVKLKRLSRIIEIQRKITENKKREQIGTDTRVLVERISKKNKNEILARTEKNDMVVFTGTEKMIGSFFNIQLLSLKGSTFQGKIK